MIDMDNANDTPVATGSQGDTAEPTSDLTVPTSMRLDADLWKAVKIAAIHRGCTATSIVTEALADWLERNAQPVDGEAA